MIKNLKGKALKYHEGGKIGTTLLTEIKEEEDLSLAYSPGVAYPCKEIEANPIKAYDYTSKGHLIAVISNGTAVLGLGDIGALASKPVMEGKAVLFKKFAGVDCYDIEVAEKDPDKFIDIVKAISGTFGGINLEDIKAPECFYIERRLKAETDIPVFHDDQHGTAIVSLAAIINATYLVHKKISELKVVILGAGAAAVASARMYKELGISDIYMYDSKGLITSKRAFKEGDIKLEFARDCEELCLKDCLKNADVLLGLSRANTVSGDDISLMAKDPLIFALANPDPEIEPELAHKARPDAIIATGRSDYPNQINNVLAFPYIFKAALKCRSSHITMGMKLATAHALAALARESVSKELEDFYHHHMEFGREYIVPTAVDPRLATKLCPAIIEAARKDGVARI